MKTIYLDCRKTNGDFTLETWNVIDNPEYIRGIMDDRYHHPVGGGNFMINLDNLSELDLLRLGSHIGGASVLAKKIGDEEYQIIHSEHKGKREQVGEILTVPEMESLARTVYENGILTQNHEEN